jgi:molybdenum-dependent DNA-binding transcriptional regulator ModE
MTGRAIKAVRLVRQGRSIAQAAKEAGVSEYWLRLKMDKIEGIWR